MWKLKSSLAYARRPDKSVDRADHWILAQNKDPLLLRTVHFVLHKWVILISQVAQ